MVDNVVASTDGGVERDAVRYVGRRDGDGDTDKVTR